MKYCSKCGTELVDEAVICVRCGSPTPEYFTTLNPNTKAQNSTFTTLAKVFMIIGTVLNSLLGLFIPLAWCLPMTIIYFNKRKNGQPIGTGFKICSLLFVSLLGGIFMLVDNDQ